MTVDLNDVFSGIALWGTHSDQQSLVKGGACGRVNNVTEIKVVRLKGL
jgi:hypothetical protein